MRDKSKNHHWWPVGLQSYWTDRAGDVSWIDPDGEVRKKRCANRKIGFKIHGHTLMRGTGWETNFESEFDVDNQIHNIVTALKRHKPFGSTPAEFFALLKLFLKKDRRLLDMCKFYQLDASIHRNLLLLVFSLIIRSPATRNRYENHAKLMQRPPDEEVGKMNMLQNYRAARRLCEHSLLSNQYFVLLHSPLRKFIFGDGSLDWLTGSLTANRVNGRALIPLTPNLCVYFCTPNAMRLSPNCASLSVAPWLVDWVNDIVQIYSRDKLFFVGRPPKLSEAFRKRQFLEHKRNGDALIDMLDEICGNGARRSSFSQGTSWFA